MESEGIYLSIAVFLVSTLVAYFLKREYNKSAQVRTLTGTSTASLEEGAEFKNVLIISSRFKEALIVSCVGTVYILLCCFAIVCLSWAAGISLNVGWTVFWLLGIPFSCFLMFYLSSLVNDGNSFKKYSGLGAAYDLANPLTSIFVSGAGLTGVLELPWEKIKEIKSGQGNKRELVILRRPLWLYDALGGNILTLGFEIPEDAVAFEESVRQYIPHSRSTSL